MAAGAMRHGLFRASDADREQAIENLKSAFVHGRLARDELGRRVGQALASRTYAELTAITADIAASVTEAEPSRAARAQTRKPVNKKAVAWGACAIVLLPALGAAFLTYYGGFIILFVLACIGFTVTSTPSRQSP
jgi:hypothetical protein